MRYGILGILLLITTAVCGQAGFSLDELLLKRYDSKKKYPATVLRNEPDAFPDLIAVSIYQGKSLYTGRIIDEKGSLKIEATVNDGSIVDFFSWDSEATRRQVYHVSTNGMYAWYASDSVFYDNQLFTSAIYYQNAEGNVMMIERVYGYNNMVTETSYRLGTLTGDEIEYFEPLKDGLLRVFDSGRLMSQETYVDGYIDGMVVYYARSKTILQCYYVNAATGLYGTYYEYDTIKNLVTVGQYTDQGIETGQWISKYSDSSVAGILWIGDRGNPDSSKVWDMKGNLVQVEYNYWRSSKTPGVNDYVHYNKTWFANGQVASYMNYNPGSNDTITSVYDVTGILLSVDRNMNGKLQSRTWNTNGKPKTERYGVPSGITGVTLRDSIYREWLSDGKLVKERYYDKGEFIRSTDSDGNQLLYSGEAIGSAYCIAMGRKSTACKWDSCSVVSIGVLDSISAILEYTYASSRQNKTEATMCFQKAFETQGYENNGAPVCRYNITLAQQESVKLDSSGKIVTKNIALNQFLDSLHLLGLGVAPLGHYEKKKGKSVSDFSVTTTDVHSYLNLFYINRRLDQLAPGSSISIYSQPTSKLAPELIYIPQGEKTPTGYSPVTVVAVANEGSTRELKVGARTIPWDNRPFYVFYVYGDGEVEFVRTTYKDTILLQYRGEQTGIYETKTRR